MATEKKSPTWLKDLLVAFAATTLSIILTFGTTGVINRVKQKQERKLTALMVMSSIEQFARDLDSLEQRMALIDSVATWLLGIPIDDVIRLGDEPFDSAFSAAFVTAALKHDKTAETIFSSHIDTWKNMGNFQFIDNVGACFSSMNWMEEYYNEAALEYQTARDKIYLHPDEYPGKSLAEKYLRNEDLRRQMLVPNIIRDWLCYCAADLRRDNRRNMLLIGISEDEVMAFTDDLGKGEAFEEEELNQRDFDRPRPNQDSLKVQLSFARQIDSLLRVK